MREILSIMAGLLQIAGFIPYIKATLKRKTNPAKTTWIIWASLDTITLAGMWAESATNGQIIGGTIGAWTVLVLSLRYGIPGWTRLDKLCLGGTLLSIMLWQIFRSPAFGVVTSLVVMSIGSIPTLVSAWIDSKRENKAAWIIYWVSGVCATIAVPHWTLIDGAQPIVYLAIDSAITFVVCFRSR